MAAAPRLDHAPGEAPATVPTGGGRPRDPDRRRNEHDDAARDRHRDRLPRGSRPGRPGPRRTLDGPRLDRVTAAGAAVPLGWGSVVGLAAPGRSTEISTQISIPVSTAVAICSLCSGDAGAVALSDALGAGQAQTSALTGGAGRSLASSTAIGLFALPSAPTPAGGTTGGGR
jgi:hypothetical protein